MGSGTGRRVVPGIAPSRPTLIPTTPGTPSPASSTATRVHGDSRGLEDAVGLKSVAQLSLGTHFSGFKGMTEVYNLVELEDPNDHNVIPGNK